MTVLQDAVSLNPPASRTVTLSSPLRLSEKWTLWFQRRSVTVSNDARHVDSEKDNLVSSA